MATLATQADIEAMRGPRWLQQRLAEAYEPSDPQPTKDALAQARLDAALAEGDKLIRQFLDVGSDWATVDSEAKAVLRPFARDEAIYALWQHSRTGAPDAEHEAAKMRRVDLAKMREREQWPGTTATQSPMQGESVTTASPFRREKLRGFV